MVENTDANLGVDPEKSVTCPMCGAPSSDDTAPCPGCSKSLGKPEIGELDQPDVEQQLALQGEEILAELQAFRVRMHLLAVVWGIDSFSRLVSSQYALDSPGYFFVLSAALAVGVGLRFYRVLVFSGIWHTLFLLWAAAMLLDSFGGHRTLLFEDPDLSYWCIVAGVGAYLSFSSLWRANRIQESGYDLRTLKLMTTDEQKESARLWNADDLEQSYRCPMCGGEVTPSQSDCTHCGEPVGFC